MFGLEVQVSEVLRGMAISSAILLPVVVLIVICSIAAVRRGEASMRGETHGAEPELRSYVTGTGGAAVAAKPEKSAVVVVTEDPSVMEIILLGLGLFVLTIMLLVGVSVVSHM
jgi:hypothetical protein